ncbi:MAG: hypothetical protein COW30_12675 [Rhodospirillales bacterium CG15_BIG_FIL_POST_REV_8_21_14_020_66_15]|nr:MAG: hypothetical protein COW30_12675 [Rhodospirillales bacterium CG15_BIG_FIL_POST_REV_8_21_14_020_66_15]
MGISGTSTFPAHHRGEGDGNPTFLEGGKVEDGGGEPAEKSRVAVGVFTTLESVGHALDEFQSQPPTGTKLCLLADRSAFDGELAARIAARGADNVCVVLAEGDDGENQPASAGGTGNAAACRHVTRLEEWLDARIARTLRRHLKDGACLLFAKVDEPAFEKFACSVLIRNSVGQVQVHDVFMRT